jgi:hypothetical protein
MQYTYLYGILYYIKKSDRRVFQLRVTQKWAYAQCLLRDINLMSSRTQLDVGTGANPIVVWGRCGWGGAWSNPKHSECGAVIRRG